MWTLASLDVFSWITMRFLCNWSVAKAGCHIGFWQDVEFICNICGVSQVSGSAIRAYYIRSTVLEISSHIHTKNIQASECPQLVADFYAVMFLSNE